MCFNMHRQRIEDKMVAPQYLKTINDCARLVNETKNPDVYFARYDLLIEKSVALHSVKTIKFKGDSPKKILQQVWDKKDLNCYEFIERYSQSVKNKIWSLKTEKGKLAQAENFHDSLLKYYDKMSEANICECERQYYLLLGEASPEYREKVREMDLNCLEKEERGNFMANFCSNCGAPVTGGKFCSECGKPLNEVNPTEPAIENTNDDLLEGLFIGCNASSPLMVKRYAEQTGCSKNEAKAIVKDFLSTKSFMDKMKAGQSQISAGGAVRCPKCGSANFQVMGNDRKFSVGKAAGGMMLAGGVGALAGFSGKKGKYEMLCNNCGYRWKTK